MAKEVFDIGTRREVLWDDYLTDKELTTASLRVVPAIKRELVYLADAPWEGDCFGYTDIIKDENGYKMYYKTCKTESRDDGIDPETMQLECLLESKDGVNWVRPNLGLYCFNGSYDNNIIMPIEDNFSVFIDTNPACPPDKKYKVVSQITEDGVSRLWYYTSPDGYHFTKEGIVTEKGTFDSQNTCFYKDGRYVCYARGFHDDEEEDMRIDNPKAQGDLAIRDVRVLYSEDFKNWTDPVRIRFNDDEEIPLYTNVISEYPRAPHMLVGFPVRYIGRRKEWTPNYDRLGGKERRKQRMKLNPRLGLAMNDCMFMSSRDGLNWNRFRKAFITPGIENDTNWNYPNGYVSHGFLNNTEDTYSFYINDEQGSYGMAKLYRYETRVDGFACYESAEEEALLVTKPVIFDGKTMRINFASSALGYVFVDFLDEDGNQIPGTESYEMFGNNTNAEVCFVNTDTVEKLAGKPVKIRFRMRDTELYSYCFEK